MPYKVSPIFILLPFALVIFFWFQHVLQNQEVFCPVTKFVDGETFWLEDGPGKGMKIRLRGLDTLESIRSFNKEEGHYGNKANDYLCQKL